MNGFVSDSAQYNPQNALWLGKVSQLAYAEDPAVRQTLTSPDWGFTNFVGVHDAGTDTHGFAAGNDDFILISFRGTEQKLQDWMTNLDAIQTDGPGGNGKVHLGFYHALDTVWDQLKGAITTLNPANKTIWVTGHSLGAALATLAVARLLNEKVVSQITGLYTYGKPRVGNQQFASWFDTLMPANNFRFVNDDDIVPHVPPEILDYKHEGTFLYFDGYGQLKTSEGLWTLIKSGLGGEVNAIWKDRTLVPAVIYDHLIAHYIEKLGQNSKLNPLSQQV